MYLIEIEDILKIEFHAWALQTKNKTNKNLLVKIGNEFFIEARHHIVQESLMQPIQTDKVLTGKSLMERDQHHNIYFGAVFIHWHNIHK